VNRFQIAGVEARQSLGGYFRKRDVGGGMCLVEDHWGPGKALIQERAHSPGGARAQVDA
jgi:hypothetical protein